MRLFFVFIILLLNNQGYSQTKLRIVDSAVFYGSLRIHGIWFNKDVQLQENSPRIGTYVSRNINKFRVDVKLEFGVHLIDGYNLNNDANTASEFIANPLVQQDAFSTRLGYASLWREKIGTLSVGKQWGVYHDVANFTDKFLVYGGNANGVYTGRTDGGWKGTGRATNALVYRGKMGPISIGVQTQFFGVYNNFAYSIQYKTKSGLTVGLAYNNAGVGQSLLEYVNNISSRTYNLISGFKYEDKKIYLAMTFSQNQHEILQIDDSTVTTFPTLGYELLMNYNIFSNFVLETGFNASNSSKKDKLTGLNYNFFSFIAGLHYDITPGTQIYLTARVSNVENYTTIRYDNAIALGFKYTFDFSSRKRTNLFQNKN